ncbi:MAG: hypothetical protein KDD47_17345 [Acidobacteria bacterium]|nr:hypothetical protein [Acidobacteriota bacterium]
MIRFLWLFALAAVAGVVYLLPFERAETSAGERPPAEVRSAPPSAKEVLSPSYLVDRKYRSMKGPYSQQDFLLEGGSKPELLWVTGYRAVMVEEDGETQMAQEFMCHSNLDIDPRLHNQLFSSRNPISGRLFTLSQGQLEIQLPEGFGMPLLSTESLELTTQVLNLNYDEIGVNVRHKVRVDYLRDKDLKAPIRPLFPLAVYGLASLEEEPATFGRLEEEGTADEVEVEGEGGEHGPSCLVRSNAASHEYKDPLGRRFTGHWVVKPGREENRTLVTEILDLPFDTTVHYIAVHLHPFAETLELKDLTTGETVFKSRVRPAEKGIGIEHVEHFSSREGIPLYRSHDYELVSVYDNTSGEDQDSMAVMYMYLLDKRFEPPAV